MKRWTESRILPLLLAALLALAGCQGPGRLPSTELSSIPMTPDAATLYQYETRQVTNQAELDSWRGQFCRE